MSMISHDKIFVKKSINIL